MNFIIKSVLTSLLILSGNGVAFGGISQTGIVTGRVVKFNKETVTLSQRGHHVIVPRKSIPKHIKLRMGEEVSALVKKGKRNTASNKKNSKAKRHNRGE